VRLFPHLSIVSERAMVDADSAPDASPSPLTGWYALTVLLVALLLSYTDRFIINLIVDPIRAELALTDVQISLLQGAGFAVIFALAGLPCGRLADRLSRRNLIAAGVLVWSAGTIACGLAGGFGSFFAARVAVGLGEAALVPAASSLIIDLFAPRRRGIALGVFSLGATFGTGAALFVGGLLLRWIEAGVFDGAPLVGALSPWRKLMVLVGLPGFLLPLLLLLVAEPARRHSSGLLPLRDVARRLLADNGTVLRVALVKAVLSIGDWGLVAWLPTLLQRSYGLTPLQAGGILALAITAGGATSSVVGGALSDQVARRWGTRARVVLLPACYMFAVAGALAVLLSGTAQTVGVAFGIWAFGSIGGYVIGHVVMQESVPNEMRATTIALSLAAMALIGMSFGPTLVPLVAEHAFGAGALQPAMGTVALVAALMALVVVWPPVRRGVAAALREAVSG
jgi:MFS family permease